MKTLTAHPQSAEISRLLAHLVANGFSISCIDDGDDELAQPKTEAEALAAVLAVGSCSVFVRHPSRPKLFHIFIVLGNGPGELCADYAAVEPLKSCLEAFADAEEARAAGPFTIYSQSANSSEPPTERQTVTGEENARKFVEDHNREEADFTTQNREVWTYSATPTDAEEDRANIAGHEEQRADNAAQERGEDLSTLTPEVWAICSGGRGDYAVRASGPGLRVICSGIPADKYADARLIATAPQLLAALVALAGAVDTNLGPGFARDIQTHARAVITKATA